MRNFSFSMLLFLILSSCTVDKTDYENEINTVVPEYFDFKEAASAIKGDYKVSVEALNGTFYKGYNEIRLKIIDIQTGSEITADKLTFLPVVSYTGSSRTTCPHSHVPVYKEQETYYSGYAVFTSESDKDSWELNISFEKGGQKYDVELPVSVKEQLNKNKNMTFFTGNDKKQYIIALVSPQKPKVSENELVAGIYEYSGVYDPEAPLQEPSGLTYIESEDYILQLDPRMPEPSMGNHSSPNNRDLTQGEDGLYHGIVNYTMTGNWTLNFILLNADGKIIKGTVVPPDFTPGTEGIKSDLYIDILF